MAFCLDVLRMSAELPHDLLVSSYWCFKLMAELPLISFRAAALPSFLLSLHSAFGFTCVFSAVV